MNNLCALLITSSLCSLAVGCSRTDDDVPAAAEGTPQAEPAAPAAEPEAEPAAPANAAEAEPAPPPDSAPPTIAPHTVLRPTFDTSEGPISAGTGSLISWKGKTLFVTAHHLLGKAGGMSREYGFEELPKEIKGVTARSAEDLDVAVKSSQVVSIPNAARMEMRDLSHDIAAFVVDEPGNVPVLKVAETAPLQGERVYLLAEVEGGKELVHPARVGAVLPEMMTYAYDDADLKTRATSGAAVVNARGELVGIHLGGGRMQDKLWGSGQPLSAIRANLDKATGL